MRTLLRALPLVGVATATLMLAGCGGGGDADNGDDAPAPSSTSTAAEPTSAGEPTTQAEGASGGACPSVPQEGYDLFSSDAISEAPEAGAVWGDGSLISWTFADGGEHIIGVDMSYVNDAGDAIPMSGIFLDDMGGGTVGSTLLVFDSDTNGKPGFMTLTETDGTDTETLGVYCVTFAVSE